jgi:hypothetical protein
VISTPYNADAVLKAAIDAMNRPNFDVTNL